MHGRQPNLPIDFLLGNSKECDIDIDIDKWIQIHEDKMCYAYKAARDETRKNESIRKQLHESVRTTSNELMIGCKVYIRNREIKGRDKIQDKWRQEVYVIIDKPSTSIYKVKPENSDKPVKIVNKPELKELYYDD